MLGYLKSEYPSPTHSNYVFIYSYMIICKLKDSFKLIIIIILCKQLLLQIDNLKTNAFCTVICFQVFLFNTNNFSTDLRRTLTSTTTTGQTGLGSNGLVPLFNVIAIFELFNAMSILREEQQCYYLSHNSEDKRVHAFPMSISPKVNNSATGVCSFEVS